MKLPLALTGMALSISLEALAVDPAARAPAAPQVPGTPNLDLAEFATADGFWKELQKLQELPPRRGVTRDDSLAQLRPWLSMQKTVADAFAQKFPDDRRCWQAKMISIRAELQIRRFSGQASITPQAQIVLREIANAPDAPVGIRGEAAFMSAASLSAGLSPENPAGYVAFHKAAADFLAQFPDHPLAPQMRTVQLQVLRSDPTPEGAAVAKTLASSSDLEIARLAKSIIAQNERLAELKSRPVDLKFTAIDGHPIDFASLRGKVVLVDFWASWCPQCIADMPNVAETYGKLHDKGFEIVGISLDEDKAAMESALKMYGMTWPQYFDGAGWKNKISASFGIEALPAAWLLDKSGMLRMTNLRGEALAAGVEKLLAE